MSAESQAPIILDIEKPELSEEDKELLSHPAVGGLIFFTRNFVDRQQLAELVKELRMLRPELLLCVDHEGGRVQRFREGFTRLPPMQNLGLLYQQDPRDGEKASEALGWIMAAELLAFDIDLSFAPVLDLDDHYSKIIGDRSFSNDPELAIKLAEGFMRGMSSAGMAATGKHFPGHGGVCEDSHTELPVDHRSLKDLQARDLLPFERLLPQLQGLMPAHIIFPEVDELPVGFSSVWLQQILRSTMGFQGLIFSDDLSMEGAALYEQFSQRAEAALQAGCDAILVCNNRKGAIEVVEYVERTREFLNGKSLQSMRNSQSRLSGDSIQSDLRYDSALEYVEILSA